MRVVDLWCPLERAEISLHLGSTEKGLWPWDFWVISQWKELKRNFKALHLLICLSSSETSEWQQSYKFKKKPSGQQDGSKVSAPKSDELSSVHSGTQGGKRELSPMELPSGLRMCTKECMCLCMRTHTIIITHDLFKIEKQNILFLFGLIFFTGERYI